MCPFVMELLTEMVSFDNHFAKKSNLYNNLLRKASLPVHNILMKSPGETVIIYNYYYIIYNSAESNNGK